MNRSISDVSHPETVTFDIKPLKKACSSPSNDMFFFNGINLEYIYIYVYIISIYVMGHHGT